MIDKILKEALEEILKETSAIALPIENLSRYQEQCDMDGVMVKVSRQALDQTLAAIENINSMAVVALAADIVSTAKMLELADKIISPHWPWEERLAWSDALRRATKER